MRSRKLLKLYDVSTNRRLKETKDFFDLDEFSIYWMSNYMSFHVLKHVLLTDDMVIILRWNDNNTLFLRFLMKMNCVLGDPSRVYALVTFIDFIYLVMLHYRSGP